MTEPIVCVGMPELKDINIVFIESCLLIQPKGHLLFGGQQFFTVALHPITALILLGRLSRCSSQGCRVGVNTGFGVGRSESTLLAAVGVGAGVGKILTTLTPARSRKPPSVNRRLILAERLSLRPKTMTYTKERRVAVYKES